MMCGENRRYFLILFAGLLLSCVAGVLQGEEPDRWYLISETELRSIELYREKSEAEKQNWLLQARHLRETAERLRRESETLNSQLSQAREAGRRLEQSFNGYEADRLTLLSWKNGEIAGLKEEAANEKLGKEKYKGRAAGLLIMVIALAVAWIVFLGVKIYRFFRPTILSRLL